MPKSSKGHAVNYYFGFMANMLKRIGRVLFVLISFVLFYNLLFPWMEIGEIRKMSHNRSLITFRLSNRWGLGNEMFALASTYGIMRSYNHESWLLCVDRKAFILNVFDLDNIKNCKADMLIKYLDAYEHREAAYGAYDARMRNLPTNHHMVVGRFLQSWRYFKDAEDEIRRLYTFKNSLLKKAQKTLSDAITQQLGQDYADNVLKIGIHVRRGNMAQDKELLNYGYKVADKSYIIRAMAFYRAQFPTKKMVFIVCSDSIGWCKKELLGQNNVVTITTGQPELDLAILSICNHSIITVGTFGWWAAWLANGTTVYYKDWPQKDSALAHTTDHKDYFPSTWIAL